MAGHFRRRRSVCLYSVVGPGPLLASRPSFGRSDLSMDVIAICVRPDSDRYLSL